MYINASTQYPGVFDSREILQGSLDKHLNDLIQQLLMN